MPLLRPHSAGVPCAMLAAMLGSAAFANRPPAAPQFSVSFSPERSAQPLDGRVLLLLSTDRSAEPRMQISISYKTQMVFGLDVDRLEPGKPVPIDDGAFGYPIRYLRDVPPGEYLAQAVLNRYETFH